jgi:hypothetical protein
LFISRIWGADPSKPIVIIFGTSRDLAKVINCAKFLIDRSRAELASFCQFVEKTVYSMEKTVPAKIVFAGWKKPPGKNPAKLALQTFIR